MGGFEGAEALDDFLGRDDLVKTSPSLLLPMVGKIAPIELLNLAPCAPNYSLSLICVGMRPSNKLSFSTTFNLNNRGQGFRERN